MNDNPFLTASERASAAQPSQPNTPRHILMVDDDNSVRQISAQALLGTGYHVESAEDGASAWELLQAGQFNLLITDQGMPRVTGMELLQKLHVARMAVLVIMATGTVPETEFAKCPWLQPAATLLKPYTVAELLDTVKEVLRVSDAARERIVSPDARSLPPTFVAASH